MTANNTTRSAPTIQCCVTLGSRTAGDCAPTLTATAPGCTGWRPASMPQR